MKNILSALPSPRILALTALVCVGTGCAGYRLGSMLPESIQTVHLPTVINETDEPLLEAEATRALAAQVRFDGTLKVAGEEVADTVLEVRLLSYRILPVTFSAEQDATPDKYRALLTASYVFRDRKTGKVLSGGDRVEGDAVFDTTGDLTQAKTEAIPDVTRDLAENLISRVVETW
jgi:hypothetical protein